MNNKNKILGIYLPVFAVATLAATLMRTIACIIHFDYDTGYFNNNVLIGISDAVVAAAALFLLSFIITARKDIRFIPSFTTPATYVPTGIVAAAIFFFAADLITKLANTLNELFYLEYEWIYEEYEWIYKLKAILTPQTLLPCFCVIFAILSVVHFALTALIEPATSAARANFGLSTVIFLAICAIIIYFDTSRPINSPSKILDEITLLFAAVFFLYETRLSMGREKWREYIGFGFVGALLAAYSSIPTLIFYFAKSDFSRNDYMVISDNIYLSAVIFALFIFIVCRLILTSELIEDKINPKAENIIKIASAREIALNPPAEETEEPETQQTAEAPEKDDETGEIDQENQITIEDITDAPQETDSSEEPTEISGAPTED